MAKAWSSMAASMGRPEVAQAIAAGLEADLAMADTLPDVEAYELVVIGSPIYRASTWTPSSSSSAPGRRRCGTARSRPSSPPRRTCNSIPA